MTTAIDSIVRGYLDLAFAIDRHIPGYIDAYFGPAEWREQAKAHPLVPAGELAEEASRLAGAIAAGAGLEPQRQDFLTRQVRAMQTSLRILQGERLSLVEEVQGLYDVTPEWVDESVFAAAQRVLDELLPPGDSLAERMQARKKAAQVPVEQIEELLSFIRERLRSHTQERFPLPPGESFEIQLVKDQPWYAYNWYLGNGRSRIEINAGLPQYITDLAFILAHEGYPGHHTELAVKETRLVQGLGWMEHSLSLINSPTCLVAEGLANCGLEVLMTGEDWVRWHTEELFPRAGFSRLDARREQRINLALRKLDSASGNAAFLIHDRDASDEVAMAYLQRYRLDSEEEARLTVDFLRNPVSRSYVFNYFLGSQLVEALLAAKGNPVSWFTRLLSEPVTPSQLRQWIAG